MWWWNGICACKCTWVCRNGISTLESLTLSMCAINGGGRKEKPKKNKSIASRKLAKEDKYRQVCRRHRILCIFAFCNPEGNCLSSLSVSPATICFPTLWLIYKCLLLLTLPSRKTGKDEEGARCSNLTQLLTMTMGRFCVWGLKYPLVDFYLPNRTSLIIANLTTMYREECQTDGPELVLNKASLFWQVLKTIFI